MRVIVAGITGIFIALYFMYWIIPLLNTEHTNFSTPLLINTTDATVVTSYNLGQGFYQVLPIIPIFIFAFVIISYALKRDAGD
jgi:hypothetical protein